MSLVTSVRKIPSSAKSNYDASKDSNTSKSTKATPEDDGRGHPIGTKLVVKWLDTTLRECEVIERSLILTSRLDPKPYKYYVHFKDFNRRMDQWVTDEEIVGKAEEVNSDEEGSGGGESRGLKRKHTSEYTDAHDEHDEHEGMDAASLKEHEEVTKVKNVSQVAVGRHVMDTWYFSPFPKELLPDGSIDMLYFCEFCLSFFPYRAELSFHMRTRCKNNRSPPGNEIYRGDTVSMFEVDGIQQREYCQNLCYLSKLFLDHKTLYYDVDPFLFYVLCERDARGCHLVGYYSKEKYSELGYNLACILTLPCHQRKGYGGFLISFSYELSKKEEKVGSPEKPLSDLGAVSYRKYWTWALLTALLEFEGEAVSIMDLTRLTSIKTDDVIATLQQLGLIKYYNGQHVITANPQALDRMREPFRPRGPDVNPERLHWAPLITPDVKKDKWMIRAKRGADEPE